MDINKKFIALNDAIENKYGPLSWVDITKYEEGTGSISFTDDDEDESTFFNKMYKIKEFIKEFGYSASLTRFEADKLCPYHEARIDINFNGGEL